MVERVLTRAVALNLVIEEKWSFQSTNPLLDVRDPLRVELSAQELGLGQLTRSKHTHECRSDAVTADEPLYHIFRCRSIATLLIVHDQF